MPSAEDDASQDVLSSLSSTIARNIAIVNDEHKRRGLEPLHLDKAVAHPTDSAAVELLPSIKERKARDEILSAASRLTALVDHPVSRLAKLSSAYLDVSVLHFAAENGIPDLIERLSNSRKDGAVAAEDVARAIHTDPLRTARLLRYLTALHVFTETSEGFFANNRYSIQFKKGSPLEAVFGMGVHDVGPPALRLGEFMKSPHALLEDATGHLPLNLHFQYPGKSMFSWMNEPFNKDRMARFNQTMVMKSQDSYAVVADLPWEEMIPQGGTLVDVGGGVGSLAHSVQKARPDITVVVQDQEGMIEQAKAFWSAQSDGQRATLLVHDFFQRNPTQGAHLYVFRAIFHNWNDDCCAKILKATMESMGEDSRILIIDAILNPVTVQGRFSASVNELRSDTQQDVTMMTLFPSLERTRRDWDRLLDRVGLRICRVFEVRSRKTAFEVAKL